MARYLCCLLLLAGVFAGCSTSGTPDQTGDGDMSEPEGPIITPEQGNGSLPVGMPAQDGPPTPEQIAILMPLSGTLDNAASAVTSYRRVGEANWHLGHPLHRLRPDFAEANTFLKTGFAGLITGLEPGQSYEIHIAVKLGAVTDTRTITLATRALPPASKPKTKQVMAGASAAEVQAAFAALAPGDVLELADGTYTVDGLFLDKSGAEDNPIVVRGASRAGVVLSDSSGWVLDLRNASHVVIENLTLQGSGVDSGTASSSGGIRFWDGASQDDVTIRNLEIRGVDMGVIGWAAIRRVMVYDCTLKGNNDWDQDLFAYGAGGAPGTGDGMRDGEQNIFWNDDGLRLCGQGNVAFNNTLHGFGDAFAVQDGVDNVAVHFYRNEVTMTGDDGFEGDYAVRNIGFYDNHIQNAMTFVSFDPLFGGPAYIFRNVAINIRRGPFKLNNTNTGILLYNNTIVTTDGANNNPWTWNQSNNGAINAWSFRNNIIIRRNVDKTLALESGGENPIDFTNNGWFPDGSVWWTSSGGSFTSLSAAFSSLPATTPLYGTSTKRHENDLIVESDPFDVAIPLGANYQTLVTTRYDARLRAGAAPVGKGTPIAGITDGYTGAAPDIGGVLAGRPVPIVGDRTTP